MRIDDSWSRRVVVGGEFIEILLGMVRGGVQWQWVDKRRGHRMTRLGSANGKGQISGRITYFPRTKDTEKAKSDGEHLVNNST